MDESGRGAAASGLEHSTYLLFTAPRQQRKAEGSAEPLVDEPGSGGGGAVEVRARDGVGVRSGDVSGSVAEAWVISALGIAPILQLYIEQSNSAWCVIFRQFWLIFEHPLIIATSYSNQNHSFNLRRNQI